MGCSQHAKTMVLNKNPLFENLQPDLHPHPHLLRGLNPSRKMKQTCPGGVGGAAALTACLKSRVWEQE